jgi:transcriptional regulator with XRE-family HTH domain
MSEGKEKKVIHQNDLRFIVAAFLKSERLKRKANPTESKQWTLQYVGEQVNKKYGTNWGKQYVGQVENGKRLSFDSVAKIADVLEIDWEEKFKENLI